jgi:hypothetical protein
MVTERNVQNKVAFLGGVIFFTSRIVADPSPRDLHQEEVESVTRLETDMKRGRFTEEQIIGVLREQEAGLKTADLCRKPGISEATTPLPFRHSSLRLSQTQASRPTGGRFITAEFPELPQAGSQ